MPRLPRSFQTIYHRQPINFFLSKPSAKVLKTANQRHKRHKLNPSILPGPTNILIRLTSPPCILPIRKTTLGLPRRPQPKLDGRLNNPGHGATKSMQLPIPILPNSQRGNKLRHDRGWHDKSVSQSDSAS